MTDNFDKELGATLRQFRMRAKISQTEMANRLGVTKMAVSHWEIGDRAMTAINLKKYCDVLGVKMQDVFDRMES